MADKIVLELEVDADERQITGQFNRIENIAERKGAEAGREYGSNFSRRASSSLTTNIGGALTRIGSRVAGIAAALAAGFAARGVVRATQSIERIETQFTTLLGSVEAARAQVQDLTDFAARTPFRLEGLSQASAQLLSFGFESETIIDRLRVLGDVAAGSNSDLSEVALIFGQVSAAGKLTGERLLQLQERAIPIGRALADTLGVAESQVRDLVSSGQVGFAEFEKAFRSLTEAGGLFEGATARQAATLGGLLSTLSDNFFALQVAVGRALGPVFRTVIQQAIGTVQSFTESVSNNIGNILSFLTSAIDVTAFLGITFNAAFEGAARGFGLFAESLLAGVRVIAAGLGQLAGVAARVASAFGQGGELVESLREFEQETSERLLQSVTAVNAQLDSLGQPIDSAGLQQSLLEIREAVVEAQADIANSGIVPTPEGIAQNQELTDERAAQFTTLTDKVRGLGEAFKETAGQFQVSSKQIATALTRGVGTAAGNAFSAFGQAIATGQDALSAFGTALLQAFGQSLVQLGTGFILQGIAQSIAGFGSGAPLIAAGAALATFGGVLSGLAGGGAPTATGGGVGTVDSGFGGDQTNFATQQPEQREESSTSVNLTIQGDVLDSEESGTRIAQILNDAFDKEGVIVNRGVLA